MTGKENAANQAVSRTDISQTDYKRSLAYQCLGVDPSRVQTVPFLRANLKRIARLLNRSRGNNETNHSRIHPLELLGFSDDAQARKVREVYLSVPASYRRLLPPEAFCHAAGVSPWRILETIAAVVVRVEAQASAVVASVLSLSVVQKTIDQALQDGGARESLIVLKAVGFLPTWGWKGGGARQFE